MGVFNNKNKTIPYCVCLKLNHKDFDFWCSDKIITKFLKEISLNSEGGFVEIYSHNMDFEGLAILDAIQDDKIFFDMFVRDSSVYWIKIFFLKITILIRSSYKIIPLSLNKLKYLLNIKDSFFFPQFGNLQFFENYPDNLKKFAISGCKSDLEIIHTVLSHILDIIQLNCQKRKIIQNSFSFSSISYKIYINFFDKWGISSNKNNSFVHNFIKNAYYGGRCEVFGNPTSDRKIHYFDYKGMYAQCMYEKFPTGVPVFTVKNLNVNNIGFHTIKYKCDNLLPFLPYKYPKLIFPNGTVLGTFWYEEIINATTYGRCEILEHHNSLIYENEAFVFKEFSENFMKIRENGPYYNIFGKNMINGLYGSFALNDENFFYVICLSTTEFDLYTETLDIKSWKKIGQYFIIAVEKNKKSAKLFDKNKKWNLGYQKRNLAYAAIISSKARIKLNNSLNLVLKDGGDLYYADTDSIFAGYPSNKINQTIGDVTWNKIFDDGVFITNKIYFLKNQNAGIDKIENPTFSYNFDTIKKNFYSEIGDWKNDENSEFIKLINEKTSKINIYDRRVFSKDKKSTVPIFIQT